MTGKVCKDLNLSGVSLELYLTNKFALAFGMRITDNSLHGSGRSQLKKGAGVSFRITMDPVAVGQS